MIELPAIMFSLILYVDVNKDQQPDVMLQGSVYSHKELCEQKGKEALTKQLKFGKVIKYSCQPFNTR